LCGDFTVPNSIIRIPFPLQTSKNQRIRIFVDIIYQKNKEYVLISTTLKIKASFFSLAKKKDTFFKAKVKAT